MDIDRDHFRLVLPEPSWSDHTTDEGYDFRLGEREQLLVVVHLAKKQLMPEELLDSVKWFLAQRIKAVQALSGNSCRFEPPITGEWCFEINVRVVGQDMRNNVLMQIGHFGTLDKVVAVSHYDYSGILSIKDFTKRSDTILTTVEVR
jgi:hypothetical protein